MSPLIDLREHFGIWERCGNTSFWRRQDLGAGAFAFFVNPLNGISIYAHEHPQVGGPALMVTARSSENIPEDTFGKVFDNQLSHAPWIKRVVDRFFGAMALISLGIWKDTPLSYFLTAYKDQTEHYIKTGEGHEQVGKDELLTATQKVLGALGTDAVKVHKIILKDEWDEFLEQFGILEC